MDRAGHDVIGGSYLMVQVSMRVRVDITEGGSVYPVLGSRLERTPLTPGSHIRSGVESGVFVVEMKRTDKKSGLSRNLGVIVA